MSKFIWFYNNCQNNLISWGIPTAERGKKETVNILAAGSIHSSVTGQYLAQRPSILPRLSIHSMAIIPQQMFSLNWAQQNRGTSKLVILCYSVMCNGHIIPDLCLVEH
jgi:hypothetical protein